MSRPSSLLAALLLVAGAACATRPHLEAPEPLELVVLSTTDIHGRVRGWDYHGNESDARSGLSRAATLVDSIREAAPERVIVVDAGDFLQGNPLAFVAARLVPADPNPVIAAMNVIGYDAAVIGNHEFDFGMEYLDRVIGQALFPMLAANVRRRDGGSAYVPWAIVRRGPVQVGIVGATTPGTMVWNRQHVAGRLEMGDMVDAVRRGAAEARRGGADIVIAVLHGGLDSPATYDSAAAGLPGENVAARLAREVPGLALVVYGHSHREMADTVIAGTRLIQPRFWAQSLGVATLRLERGGGHGGWTVASTSGALLPLHGVREHPAVLAATAAAHERTVDHVTTPIGRTPVAWRSDSVRVASTPVLDFMLEVQRRAAGAELSAGAAYTVSATLGPGNITIADLARLYPYENTLRAIRISGRQLREYLEFSARHFGTYGTSEPVITPGVPGFNFDVVLGVEYTIDLRRPAGARITALTRNGRTVAETDTFTMAINSYRQGGGGSYAMIAGAPLVLDSEAELRQLLIDEVRRRGTIRPGDYPRSSWRIVPAAAAERAYRVMHGTEREGGPPAVATDPS